MGCIGLSTELYTGPLTMIVKIALEGSEETKWLAILLGPDPTDKMVEGDKSTTE